MPTRTTLFLDRLATLVLALALGLGGAAAIWWWSNKTLLDVALPDVSSTSGAASVVETSWFPWAAAVVGVLLVLLGLRWIVAHLGSARVKRLRLSGSDDSGRLEVVGSKVADAAADVFADTLGVRSADGAVLRDRGQLVARLEAVVEPDVDLPDLARRAEETLGQLATVTGRDDLHARVQLRVATRGRARLR